MSVKLKLAAGVLLSLQLIGGAAFADDTGMAAGDVLIRLRAIGVVPDVSSTITPVGGAVSASNTAMPEVDVSYFATKNIAFELIAAVTKHSTMALGTAAGNVDLGSAWLLPPTLTAQYHFQATDRLSPYVGAGLNYTHMFSIHRPSTGPVTAIRYGDSFGPALQVGADYDLGKRWYLNLDLKKIWINTGVVINGGAINATVHLDPWVVGGGIGYRF